MRCATSAPIAGQPSRLDHLDPRHLKYLHRDSIAPYFPANTTVYTRFGPHFAGWLPKNRLVTTLTEEPREDWRVLDRLTGAIVLVPGTVATALTKPIDHLDAVDEFVSALPAVARSHNGQVSG